MTHFATMAVNESGLPADSNGSVVTPICLSTTFVKQSEQGFEYIRTASPTRNRLESSIAQLEQANHCTTFSSGMAAISAIFESIEFTSKNVIVSCDVYGGSYRYLEHLRTKNELQIDYVALWDQNEWTDSIRKDSNVRLVWIESCTNPLLRVPDLQTLVEFIRSYRSDCLVVVDSTFLTPYLLNPLKFGVDAVVHSVTKYINGHCDVLMGAICTNDFKLHNRIKHFQNSIGNVPSPFDCYLVIRGIKTLALRMQRHCENALQLSEFLQTHPAIERVIYPGLSEHPDHLICNEMFQQHAYGGMISVILKGDVQLFLSSLQIFLLAESLGGVESLVETPDSMSHVSIPKERRAALGINDKLVRISVGIEHLDDLKEDLNQALLRSINS